MPLNTAMAGKTTAAVGHDIEARWIMACAAVPGDLNPGYLDTAGEELIAHLLFPVCLEWPVILSSGHL